MELDELHVHQVGAGLVGERVTVAGVLPGVGGDLVGAPDAAGADDHRLGREQPEVAPLAVVAESAGDPPRVEQERHRGVLHEKIDPTVDAVVLERPDHLQAGAVADVGQAGIAMPAEVSLQDPPVLGPVEQRAPGLELAHPIRRLLGVKLGHPPVVEVLAAAHGIGEVDLPGIAVVGGGERGGDAALGHDGVGLAEERFGHHRHRGSGGAGLDRGAKTGAARADHQHVVGMLVVCGHQMSLRSSITPIASRRT